MPDGSAFASETPRLTKSLFLAGLQCQKRLFLRIHDNSPRREVGLAEQYLFDQGNEVTRLARTKFPGGILVASRSDARSAVDQTADLVANPATSAIFEATVVADNVLIKADILQHLGPAQWRLIEVKSGTKQKDEHLPDIAIQAHVLKLAGIHVTSACLMHLNREYVYAGGAYDLDSLFTIVDLTDEIAELLNTIESPLAEQRRTLSVAVVPDVPAGKHCGIPRECEFFAVCNLPVPPDHVSSLPRLGVKKAALLAELGITSLHHVPDDFELTDLQARIVTSVKSGQPYYSPELPNTLGSLTWPVLYMDFETWSPAPPVLTGTRAYDQIPFQWSMHIEDSPGSELRHLEFLAESEGDPRPAFLESLLRVVESYAGSIVVYSAFEATQLRSLAGSLPGSADRIERTFPRLWDLLAKVREHVYYPEFGGSFSIKSVLPAMQSEIRYDHLRIRDGATAAAAYDRVRKTAIANERGALRDALLAYCCQDTLAMYSVLCALRRATQTLRAGSG